MSRGDIADSVVCLICALLLAWGVLVYIRNWR